MSAYFPAKFQVLTAAIAIIASAMIVPFSAGARTTEINWKPIGDAILKITGRKPPKTWDVYQDEKKKERVLIEMDNRYLILDAKTKQVHEITSAQFQLHGKNFQTAIPIPGTIVSSTGWDIRDIGPAERIEVELTNENISFDVELPHPLDLRTAH